VQFDTIDHLLSDCVAPSGFQGIAGLIDTSPQVHTCRATCGQTLSGHEQYRTPTTSYVQDSLIAPKAQLVEQVGPNHELASKRAVKIETENGQHERDGHKRLPMSRYDCHDEDHSGHDSNESRRIRRVDPIRSMPSRGHTLGHQDFFLVKGLLSQQCGR
jgi:hypothetical protein